MKLHTAAPDIETRRPIGAMNYAGNQVAFFERRIASGRPMGPNYIGELMWPVEAQYLTQAEITRVGFSLMPHPKVLEQGEVR